MTSVGVGNGADLGGLEVADAHCLFLAEAAGSTGKTWRAYLSTQVTGDEPGVNARDRIGEGPWHNANGMLIASDLESLHHDNSNINYRGALNEYGHTINSGGMGNSPKQHDILTGSNFDGTAANGEADMACSNWTSAGEGSAIVGSSRQIQIHYTGPFLECSTCLTRLQPGGPGVCWRRRTVLLLFQRGGCPRIDWVYCNNYSRTACQWLDYPIYQSAALGCTRCQRNVCKSAMSIRQQTITAQLSILSRLTVF